MLGIPFRLVAQGFGEVVAHAMAFDVGFVVHVETQGVAEFVEFPLLGIVAGADGVNIAKLHELEVFQNVLPGGVVAGIGVVLMQVHSFELDGLSVHQEGLHLPFPIPDRGNLQAAETHVEAGVFPVHAQQEGVELGGFGAPAADIRQAFRHGVQFSGEAETGIGHGFSVFVQQLVEYLRGLRGAHLEPEKAGAQVTVQGGNHPKVEAAVLFLAGQVHVPLQAGDAPEVLVFQPGRLGVAVNLQHQLVLAGLQGLRDAEARQVLGVFAVAHLLPVHIDVGAALASAEVQIHFPSLPAVRNAEAAPVQGGGDRIGQNARDGILRAEVEEDIGVDGGTPSLDLPVAGNLYLVPGRGDGQLPVVFKILEVPAAVQAPVVFTLAESFGKGIFTPGEVDDLRTPGLRIYRRGPDVLPKRQGRDQKQCTDIHEATRNGFSFSGGCPPRRRPPGAQSLRVPPPAAWRGSPVRRRCAQGAGSR